MACACDQSTHGYVVAYWWVQEEVTDRFVLICHACYLGSSVYFVILYSLETWLLVGVGWRNILGSFLDLGILWRD
jgi:hypothetical protein